MAMDIYVNLKSAAESAKKALDNAAKSTSKLGRETKTTNSGMAKFFSTLKKTNNQFTNISKDANRAASSLSGFGKAVKNLATLGGIYGLANALKIAIQSSLDMIETQNLFVVALGDSSDAAEEFLTTLSDASGMDLTNLKSATGTFALLARSMGFTSQQAETLSTSSTQLALDLASLVNVPVSQALADIKSGLIGQTETMYKYGVDLTEASLKSEALAEGIDKSVRLMSQGEKMALRYNLMIKQTALSHGDFAKTIDSPANQLKILSERFVTAGRAIGTIFIPTLTVILPIANAVLIVITKLANAIATLFGYIAPDSAATGISNISEDADDATDAVGGTSAALKELKNTALGFDELHTIETDSSASGGGGGSSADVLSNVDLTSYDSGLSGIASKADVYAQQIEDAFNKIDFTNFLTSLDGLKTALDGFGTTVGAGLSWFIDNVLVPIATWTVEDAVPAFIDTLKVSIDKLNSICTDFAPQWDYIWNSFFVPIGQWTADAVITVLEDLQGWIEGLDFEPLVNSFANLADSLEPFAEDVGNGLLWFFKNVLLPLGSFTIEDLVPAFLNALSGAIDLVTAAIEALQPLFQWLWDNALQPLASWAGDAVVAILNDLGTAFTAISDWISENQGLVDGMAVTVGVFFAAWQISGVTQFVVEAGGVIPLLTTLTGGFAAATRAKIADRIAAVQLATEYVVNLAKSIASAIAQLATSVASWAANTAALVANKIAVVASTVAQWAMAAATAAWNAITVVATAVTTAFGVAIAFLTSPIGLVILAIAAIIAIIILLVKNWDKVKEVAGNVWDTICDIWGEVSEWFKKNVTDPLSNLFKNMANGIMGFFEGMINGVINGLNWFIDKVNNVLALINSVADKLGFSVDLQFNTIDNVTLPRLAQGGILKMGTMFEAGENGKAEMLGNYNGSTTVMPLENTDFVQAMYDAVASAITDTQESGGQVIENILNLDGDVIYRNQQKVSQKRGQNFGLGAFAR